MNIVSEKTIPELIKKEFAHKESIFYSPTGVLLLKRRVYPYALKTNEDNNRISF